MLPTAVMVFVPSKAGSPMFTTTWLPTRKLLPTPTLRVAVLPVVLALRSLFVTLADDGE